MGGLDRHHAPFLPRARTERVQVPPFNNHDDTPKALRSHPCPDDYNFGDKKAPGSQMTRPTTISPLICKLICPNFVPRRGEGSGG